MKRNVTFEVDDAALEVLAALGPPTEVLSLLVNSIAEGARRHGSVRMLTDESLRTERAKSDDVIARERDASKRAAQNVLRVARNRADVLLDEARKRATRLLAPSDAREFEREQASEDDRVEDERMVAAAALELELGRADLERNLSVAAERESTNRDLTGERAAADAVSLDQREANENMLSTALRLQELADAEVVARAKAEENERDLRSVAEVRETFIGILGHDLRNPLASIIMGAGTLLQRGRLVAQDQQSAERIIKNCRRMSRMIMQLLDLTHARLGGGLPLETAHTDLSEICRDIADEFGTAIDVAVTGDVTGEWDADRLSEVISNLAGNAIEHATPGTPVVIAARDDVDHVVLDVSNRGAPIPSEVLPFIFEPFRRAKQRVKSRSGNLGLGLYIANQAVIAHGGTLSARSDNGTTTFTVRLPRRPPG